MTNWIDKQSEAHLEATEWLSFGQEGFPDAVIFANDGSVLDGTYKQVRYIQEQRYQQLAEVAREMLKFLKNIEREYPRLLDPNRKPGGQILYPMPSDEYANQLEELGVEV